MHPTVVLFLWVCGSLTVVAEPLAALHHHYQVFDDCCAEACERCAQPTGWWDVVLGTCWGRACLGSIGSS